MSTIFQAGQVFEKINFNREANFEKAIQEVAPALFGKNRIYLDIKKKIGAKGKKKNIPDGYLLDLVSSKKPQLYVVENEIASHEPLRHIAVQLLEFSFSFEESKHGVKKIIHTALMENDAAMTLCEKYVKNNNYRNVDHLLEMMIFDGEFRALVIIDDVVEELYSILKKQFQFPIEVIELLTFKSKSGERQYQFTPFLAEVETSVSIKEEGKGGIDISEVDTVVVPAREDGFKEVFVGEDCWYSVRINDAMIGQIKYIAAYRVAPISAITHVAEVRSIEPYKDTGKMILYFSQPAKEISPIKMVKGGKVKGPQSIRYTTLDLLAQAKNLDDVFP